MKYAEAPRQRIRKLLGGRGGSGKPGRQDSEAAPARCRHGGPRTADRPDRREPAAGRQGNRAELDERLLPHKHKELVRRRAVCAGRLPDRLPAYSAPRSLQHLRRSVRAARGLQPTAPPLPKQGPDWVNYLHHSAAVALISTLGLFCLVVFADYAKPDEQRPRSLTRRFRDWLANAVVIIKRGRWSRIYLIPGFLVFASGLLALDCYGQPDEIWALN